MTNYGKTEIDFTFSAAATLLFFFLFLLLSFLLGVSGKLYIRVRIEVFNTISSNCTPTSHFLFGLHSSTRFFFFIDFYTNIYETLDLLFAS